MNIPESTLKKSSKFLSLLLRHKPETIGLTLNTHGWASIEDLIHLTQSQTTPFTRELLEVLVTTSDKQRFIISKDGLKIRANQGHSINIDLALQEQIPPGTLFHGTATRFINNIMMKGIEKQSRQHVHLSDNHETATNVGQRHGKPIVLHIDAERMYKSGHKFFLSENNVWLTEFVPADFITTKQ